MTANGHEECFGQVERTSGIKVLWWEGNQRCEELKLCEGDNVADEARGCSMASLSSKSNEGMPNSSLIPASAS